MRRWRGLWSRVGLGVLVLTVAGATAPASAATIQLSEVSSDETQPEALLAELRFDVSGSVLEVTVLNRTDESNTQLGTGEYAISEIYFNATSNVSALTLTSPSSGWSLQTNQRGGGEFGRFDFALVGDLARNEHPSIAAGDSLVFQFDISGTGPFDMTDFLSVESTTPPGTMPQIAQAKFVQGPEDDSAFGASGISWVVYQPKVPEPGATLLVAVGVAGVILRSRPGNALALSRRRSPRG